jgi:hypothetical protein
MKDSGYFEKMFFWNKKFSSDKDLLTKRISGLTFESSFDRLDKNKAS